MHGPEFGGELVHGVQRLNQVRELKRLPAAKRQRASSSHRVLDLSSIDVTLGKGLQHFFAECVGGANLLQEGAPYLNLGIF